MVSFKPAPTLMNSPTMTTIPEFLIRRFKELSVNEGFGIVGDFALKLFDRLSHHGFPILVTADEQGGAFAAAVVVNKDGRSFMLPVLN